MRRIAVFGSVALLALLAGVGVAGLPDSVPSDVVVSDINPSTSSAPEVSVTAGPPSSSTAAPVTTTEPARTTDAPSTTKRPTTTSSSTSSTTTEETTASAPPETPPALVGVEALNVLVVNASGVNGLATRTAVEVRAAGYVNVLVANAAQVRPDSVVFFVPGREGEAQRLAASFGVPEQLVQPRPEGQITVDNENADLWFMLGADRA